MGKRNKGEPKDNTKIKKKKTHTANEDVREEISSIETTGNGKNKKIVFDNDGESSKMDPLEKIAKDLNTNSATRTNRRSNKKNTENGKAIQNKKLIFKDDDDDGTGVPVKKVRKKKNPPEEEPGDEEIDKFCDELDAEDNVQYDNWVKLIEAKLGSSK